MEIEDHELLSAPFIFTMRETPLPCDLRPIWRIAVLLLILEQCRDRQASMEQLHVMNWAVRNPNSQSDFVGFLKGTIAPSQVIVRHDPSLSRAIDFALAEELVTDRVEKGASVETTKNNSYRIRLTEKGAAIARELLNDEECFVREKSFLSVIGKKITQSSVQQLFDWSRNQWA